MIEEIVDFLVIGSGPSGSAATWSLADTGMRIMYTSNGVKSFFASILAAISARPLNKMIRRTFDNPLRLKNREPCHST